MSAISRKQGGILDQKQVYNVRQKGCEKDSAPKEHSDVLYYLMEQSRRCFDGVVKAVPESMCVLATDVQLDDMVRFCTNSDHFAILCIDPTFCIGKFSVTPIVYQHLLLESRRYGMCMDPFWFIRKKSL